MPGRWTCIGIVAFWLAMTGWLTVSEIWARFGVRPKLQDALAAAANDGPATWTITEDDQPVGRALTMVRQPQKGGHYELIHKVKLDRIPMFDLKKLASIMGIGNAVPERIPFVCETRMEVNLMGDLHRMQVTASLPTMQVRVHISSKPVDTTQMLVRATFWYQQAEMYKREQTVPYNGRDLLMNSLSPVDRMIDLRPGQRWETPMVDPAGSLSAGFTEQILERPMIQVEVHEEIEGLDWPVIGGEFVPCLVLEAKRPDFRLRIWVRESDGTVLKQSAWWGKHRLDTIRDRIPKTRDMLLE